MDAQNDLVVGSTEILILQDKEFWRWMEVKAVQQCGRTQRHLNLMVKTVNLTSIFTTIKKIL